MVYSAEALDSRLRGDFRYCLVQVRQIPKRGHLFSHDQFHCRNMLLAECLDTQQTGHRQQYRSMRANPNEQVNDVTSPAGRDLQLTECVVH